MQTRHVLTEIDPIAKRAICSLCGPAVMFTRVNDSGEVGHYCVRPVKKRTQWRTLHVLTDYDPDTKIANCSLCGPARTFFGKGHRNPHCIGPVKARKVVSRALHLLSNIDEIENVADCAGCKARVRVERIHQWRKNGGYFICAIGKRGQGRYRLRVGTECSRCGFIPEHQCQLDVDHIDGNHKNDADENLQTLCANCHRLKSRRDKLNRTHCRKGHPFNEQNTYTPPDRPNRRYCKQCANDRYSLAKAV